MATEEANTEAGAPKAPQPKPAPTRAELLQAYTEATDAPARKALWDAHPCIREVYSEVNHS